MIPVFCRVKHDPENNQYGDCMRACVATLLDLDAEKVPHFFYDNPDPQIAHDRMTDFLLLNGLAPYYTQFDAKLELTELLEFMGEYNKHPYYILQSADHVVVCKGSKIVHDPAWYRTQLKKPDQFWLIIVLVKM